MSGAPKIRIRVVMSDCALRFEVGIKRRWFWKNGRHFDTEKEAMEYVTQYLGYADTILPRGI